MSRLPHAVPLMLIIFTSLVLLRLARAAPCDPDTTCASPSECTANSCPSVFKCPTCSAASGRRTAGYWCGQGSVKCTNPTDDPSLGYANKFAYWCGPKDPDNLVAECGNVPYGYKSGNQAFCQGSACLLVDAKYVWNCYEGHFLDRNKCSLCKTGQFRSDRDVPSVRSCKVCGTGAYQDEQGGILCKACPAGYRVGECDSNSNNAYPGWAPGEEAHGGCTSCTECSSGFFQSAAGESVCEQCPAGKFGSQNGPRTSSTEGCQTCPLGRWTGTNTGTTGVPYNSGGGAQCSPCPAGKAGKNGSPGECVECTSSMGVAPTPGLEECISCGDVALGTKWASSTTCEACPPGRSPSATYETCDQCASGKYSPDGTPCQDCPAGKAPNLNRDRCELCPVGKKRQDGESSCTSCLAGTISTPQRIECVACSSGRVAPNAEMGSCLDCGPGRAAIDKTLSCQDCAIGKFSGSFADECTPCNAGQHQPTPGSSSCAPCTGVDDFTNATYPATAQGPCFNCKTLFGSIYKANGNHDGCGTCDGGEYLSVGTGICMPCQPCSAGAERQGCGGISPGTCELCNRGYYKSKGVESLGGVTSSYLDRCQTCSACPTGSERGSSLDPCLILSGGSTTDTVTCTACSVGRYQGTAVASRNSLYPGKPEDDQCVECQTCLPGGDREQCGAASAGVCVPWETPVIESVTGSGKDGGSTTGGQPLIIEGYHFGGVETDGFSRSDIVVRYGPKSSFDSNPTASDGSLYTLSNDVDDSSFAPCTMLHYDSASKRGSMQCFTVEGVGKDLWISVQVGQQYSSSDGCQGGDASLCTMKRSSPFPAQISYGRPIVASYTVDGQKADNLNTAGNEILTISGANFGPAGTPVESAEYGDPITYSAQGCAVVDHRTVRCRTARGAGTNHKLVVTIGGQQSTVPAVGYSLPSLQTLECDNHAESGGNASDSIYKCHCAPGQQGLHAAGHSASSPSCSGVDSGVRRADGSKIWKVPAVIVGSSEGCFPANGCTLPTATQDEILGNTAPLSTSGGQRVILSGQNLGAYYNGSSAPELDEVGFGPTFALRRVLPVRTAPLEASDDSPGCALNAQHFSILCNTPPGLGNDNFWYVTVAGQTIEFSKDNFKALQGGSTSYKLPLVANVSQGVTRTNGGDFVRVEGTDFAISRNTDTQIEVWLFRSGALDPSFTIGVGGGLVITSAIGNPENDAISFPAPTSYGAFAVRVFIRDTRTGQSSLSSTSSVMTYDPPRIFDTTIRTGSPDHVLTVGGENFCSNKNCGDLMLCTKPNTNETVACGECFIGDPPQNPGDPIQQPANKNDPSLGSVVEWGHIFARVNTRVSSGCVYARVGTPGFSDTFIYSNPVSFTTNAPIIIPGGDFTVSGTSYHENPNPVYTSGYDEVRGTFVEMEVHVDNLQNPDVANTVIKVGPPGCFSAEGTATIKSIDTSEGFAKIVFAVPQGSGSNVLIKACYHGVASAPAIFHYGRPVINTVRRLPFGDTGVDDMPVENDPDSGYVNGGVRRVPTGGSAYFDYPDGYMNDLNALNNTAGAKERTATIQLNQARSVVAQANAAWEIASELTSNCTNTGNGSDCSSFANYETTKYFELRKAQDAESVAAKLLEDAKYEVVAAKSALNASAPFTMQYFEVKGSNFGSERLANSPDGKYLLDTFFLDFQHSDSRVSDAPSGPGISPVKIGLNMLWRLRGLKSLSDGGGATSCSFSGSNPCCPVWTHSRMVCRFPSSSGFGWLLNMRVGNQDVRWPAFTQGSLEPDTIGYALPNISSITPEAHPTTGFNLTLRGRNFGPNTASPGGQIPPLVTVGAQNCTVFSFSPDMIECSVGPGQGVNLPVVLTTGPGLSVPEIGTQWALSSSGNRISFSKAVTSSMDITSGPTGGIDYLTGERVKIVLNGENFGTPENDNLRVLFHPPTTGSTAETRSEPFVASVQNGGIISHSHDRIEFYQPAGYGAPCRVTVDVAGLESTVESALVFSYDAPTISSIKPFCGGRRESTDQYYDGECYGYAAPSLKHYNDYPLIKSIFVDGDSFLATVTYEVQRTGAVNLNDIKLTSGDIVRIVGMPGNTFNRQWFVRSVVPTGTNGVTSTIKKIVIDTSNADGVSSGTFVPSGAFKDTARLSKPYVRGASDDFKLLESDGCSAIVEYTQQAGFIRSSGWEPYALFRERRNAAGEQSAEVKRECRVSGLDRRQRIIIEGKNLAALAPKTVRMFRKKCPCAFSLAGEATPCRDKLTFACRAKLSGDNTCPANHDDCSNPPGSLQGYDEITKPTTKNGEEQNTMYVEEQTDTRIVVLSQSGRGRYLKLEVTVGARSVPISPLHSLSYQRPSVRAIETLEAQQGGASNFRPGDTIVILGHNFGDDTTDELEDSIKVRLGSEFDASGNDCRLSSDCDLDKTFKLCKDLKFHKEYLQGSKVSFRGFPYISCKTQPDVAGRKNWSLSINGFSDDCSSNSYLCAYASNWPVYRSVMPGDENRAINLTVELADRTKGPLFTCAKQSQENQAYASTGELCVNISTAAVSSGITQRCEDSECTMPRALAGFWRLDLDLQWACNAGNAGEGKVCQNPVSKGYGESNSLLGQTVELISIDTAITSDGEELCVLPDENAEEGETCSSKQVLCSARGLDAPNPGACVFRRPKEAQRALGSSYLPWASENNQDRIKGLEARCSKERTRHLVDTSVYDDFPQLVQSTTCYDVVGCSPKSSCQGNNTCAEGYEWQKYRCEQFNEKNPDKLFCQTDDDCRSRSGRTQIGLGSACDLEHPEDCSRCILGPVDEATGTRNGTCECTHGAPRCGLCTQPTFYDDGDRENIKGYFRLNNECQECPENPELLLILIAVAIVVMCGLGWWAQNKKINVSILSIGVDYFQILSIFSGLRIKWPFWVKEVLQMMSIFNFNIDIAGPECAFPDFDYSTKWAATVLMPLIFGSVLLLIFLGVMLMKFIKLMCGCANKGIKYTSHGSKLLATFVLVFYFLYLSLTRRALDVFNCNPVEPDDGYLYTEFTSKDCEAGLCRCNDPDELQQRLVPYAILCLIIYSIGFPIYVAFITWYYRIQIKLDQLLRAYDLGAERNRSIDSVHFTKRKGRSDSRRIFDIRKKHHQLYYHFKPGKVYWLTVVLMKKFFIAMVALLFRGNIVFMLSVILLILFANYVLTTKHRPYMSSVERNNVMKEHRYKTEEAEKMIAKGIPRADIPDDSYLHYQLDLAIRILVKQRATERQRRLGVQVTSLDDVQHLQRDRLNTYYFDYNTVEIVLIGTSIFLALVAIMFQSGRFYYTDPETGIETLTTDETTVAFYNSVLVLAGLVLFGGTTYYIIVLIAEMLGRLPGWVLKCFASKTRNVFSSSRTISMGSFVLYDNPAAQGVQVEENDARKAEQKALDNARQLAEHKREMEAAQLKMSEEVKRLKQRNKAKEIKGSSRRKAAQVKKARREFGAKQVGEDITDANL